VIRIKPTTIYIVKYEYYEPYETGYTYSIVAYTDRESAETKIKKLNSFLSHTENVCGEYVIEELILVC
jgi:hypothetical protein